MMFEFLSVPKLFDIAFCQEPISTNKTSSIVKYSYIYCTKCCAVQQVYKREPRGHAGNVLSKIFFRWKEPWWSSTRCFVFPSAISLFVPFC